jgi:hypothetical protein
MASSFIESAGMKSSFIESVGMKSASMAATPSQHTRVFLSADKVISENT